MLLLLSEAQVFELAPPFRAEPVEGLAEIFLDFLLPTKVSEHLVDVLRQPALDIVRIDDQGIDPGLHEEQLGFKDLLQQVAPDVPVRSHALGAHALHLFFKV